VNIKKALESDLSMKRKSMAAARAASMSEKR